MKKINFNLRTCFCTKKKYYKNEMLRLCISNGKLVIDLMHNTKGYGIYIHDIPKNQETNFINKLSNKLNIKISDEDYQNIIASLKIKSGGE